jgi:hypothetical protein
MYVILTDKPGVFHTETGPGIEPLEAWDYFFCGRKRARFVIALLRSEVKVKIVEETEQPAINMVPSKFLPHFDTLEGARAEVEQLAQVGNRHTQLMKA